MRLSFGLETRQQQTQKLDPRMIQSMEILQMATAALQERVDQELAENPTLETEDVDPLLPEQEFDEENPDSPSDNETEMVVGEDANSDDFERLLKMDQEFPDHFGDGPRPSTNYLQTMADRRHDAISNIESRPVSLNDHLLGQLGELTLALPIYQIAERIISSLRAEDGGYLRANLVDLLPPEANQLQLDQAEQALAVVQQLDPRGVAARNLEECLLNQLPADQPGLDELRLLISNHLEDLRDNRLPLISRATGMAIERIQDVAQELRTLDPKPASQFTGQHIPKVVPDVIVDRQEGGKYEALVEEGNTPRLRISNYYRQRLQDPTASREEKDYIKQKVMGAQWLIKSIEQRGSTLRRVAQAIVDYQQEFLEHGPDHIVPLKMQQIADQVGVHVTTVSRAVDDKWVQTARGIFPLKRFFVGGTVGSDGEDVAWDRIRIKLQEVIDAEDKSAPYSDDGLVRQLESHGMNVARRTITKYRKKMGIPSSRQRKDWTQKSQTP
jgi:RNA polymerase sigma-54 factor